MFDLSQYRNTRSNRNQRILQPLPGDRGKKHYWGIDRGDYGIYQSEDKKRARQQYQSQRRRTEISAKKSLRFQTQQLHNFERKCQSQLQRKKYDHMQINNQEDQAMYDEKKISDFRDIKRIQLPKILKSQKQIQTTDSLMYFHPIFKQRANQEFRSKTISNQIKQQSHRHKTEDSAIQAFHLNIEKQKNKHINPYQYTTKIGHQHDEKYDKYGKKRNQIKIKSYRSYKKYTPTYASSQGGPFENYFGQGPLQYQKDQKELQTYLSNRYQAR